MITVCAGRLTPHARVAVHTSTFPQKNKRARKTENRTDQGNLLWFSIRFQRMGRNNDHQQGTKQQWRFPKPAECNSNQIRAKIYPRSKRYPCSCPFPPGRWPQGRFALHPTKTKHYAHISQSGCPIKRYLDGAVFESSLRQAPVGTEHPGVVAAHARLKQIPQLLVAGLFHLKHHVINIARRLARYMRYTQSPLSKKKTHQEIQISPSSIFLQHEGFWGKKHSSMWFVHYRTIANVGRWGRSNRNCWLATKQKIEP